MKSKFSQRLKDAMDKLGYRQYIFLALLMCCLLGVLIYRLLAGVENKQQAEKEPPKPVGTVQIVMAKQDIPQRAVVKESMLKMEDVAENQVPDGAIKDMSKVVNRPASVTIQKGDVLTDKKVYTDLKMAGFTGMIPPDCRAMSIPISDVTGIGGFAKPGDYVDVMVVDEESDKGRITGEIALQNVMLLGINKNANPPTNAQPAQEEGNGKDGDNEKKDKDKKKKNESAANQASNESMALATLAVTPQEALQLAVAIQKGKVYLTLRPIMPRDMFVLDTEYSMLVKEQPAQPPQTQPQQQQPNVIVREVPRPAASPAPEASSSVSHSGNSVEVIRGVKSTRE